MAGGASQCARGAVDGNLARLGAFASARGDARIAQRVTARRGKLATERFVVVFAGEFKRGKTTFVNALLGEDVLPTAAIPLTSVATTVTWGDRPVAEVWFLDGSSRPVPIEELHAYVTERGNPGNRKAVARAELAFPADILRDGVLLVDTPGVGSVFRASSDAARAFLPEADAAIFLTSANPPVSDSEVAFLHEVREETVRMLFVLNKVDRLSGADREEAIAFTGEVIAGAVGHEVPVYPVSARRAPLARVVDEAAELEASGLPALGADLRKLRAFVRKHDHRFAASRCPRESGRHGSGPSTGRWAPRPGIGRGEGRDPARRAPERPPAPAGAHRDRVLRLLHHLPFSTMAVEGVELWRERRPGGGPRLVAVQLMWSRWPACSTCGSAGCSGPGEDGGMTRGVRGSC